MRGGLTGAIECRLGGRGRIYQRRILCLCPFLRFGTRISVVGHPAREHRGTRQGAAWHTRHAAPRGPARARDGSRWASQALVRPARSPLAGAMPPDGARPFSGARRAPPPPVLRHARDFVRGVCARTRIRTLAAVQQSRPRAAQHGASSGRQRGSVRPRRLRRLGPAQPRRQRARGAGTVHGGANDYLPPASACRARVLGVSSEREAPDGRG